MDTRMDTRKAVANRLLKLCDGLEISLCDFINTDTFKTLEQEIK